jgi:lipoic acid synthetase
MLGLGETDEQLLQAYSDLRSAHVDFLTLGQYLQPSRGHLAVTEYVPPERFEYQRKVAEGMGFRYVAAGPLVRSSYRAGEFFIRSVLRGPRGYESHYPEQNSSE